MNANFDRPTAKIYQFPVAKIQNRRLEGPISSQTGSQNAILPNHDFRAWYHDEAVRNERAGAPGPLKS